MATSTVVTSCNENSETKETHPWRRCPIGQHFVKEHVIHVKPTQKHPDGLI